MRDIKIEINQEIVDLYNKLYFIQHPKAKKKAIEKPIYPSINQWCVMPRMSMNGLKQKWTEFGKFIIKKHRLSDTNIKTCNLEVKITFPTKTRRDIDNYCTKLIMDGFVKEGLLIDDSYFNIQSVMFTGAYEKGVSKMEFNFKDCTFEDLH